MKRLFGLAGWSGSGKTSLIGTLIPELLSRGHSVSTVKHAHHDVDLDRPGKDSYLHRTAGAGEVMLSTGRRFVLMRELRGAPEPGLAELVGRMAPVDFILVEGFKHDPIPKIEIHRPALGKPPIWPDDPDILAVASDTALPDCPVPVLALADVTAIADLVESRAAGLPAAEPGP